MTRTVLLDLGNVVLGIDFRRVFAAWARSAGIDEQRFYDRWAMDEAYEAHEVGAIDFATYAAALSKRFDVHMPEAAWRAGWNDLWTEPFAGVVQRLPEVAQRYGLYGFTNTNESHVEQWRANYRQELAAFQHIFVSSEIGRRKPSPDAYRYVCGEIGTAPAEVLFLDDNLDNVEGALSAGLNAHLVRSEAEVVARLTELL